MADREKDEPIIELTDVVEEGPAPATGGWKEPPPLPVQEKKIAEPPKIPRRETSRSLEDFKAIPESPLKKFLLAEEEPTPPEETAAAEKPMAFSPPTPQPPRPAPEPPRRIPEPPRVSPDPPRVPPEPPRVPPESSRPSLPDMEAEMRAMREALLARVEKWVAQEGVGVLERVAREIFPKLAEDMIRKQIEKLKAEAEEKE